MKKSSHVYRILILNLFLIGFLSGNLFAKITSTFDTGFIFNTWNDTGSDKGMQMAIPITLSSQIKDFDLQLMNAYTYTAVDQANTNRADLSHFLDTKLNFSYSVDARYPVDFACGLGFNLPTGKTDLSQDDMALLTIPDLMPITNFGSGLNINPYFSVSKEWEKWVAGLGAGYLWQGQYNFSQAVNSYKPGNIVTITGNTGCDINDDWQTNLFLEYVLYSKDKVQGSNYYNEGNLFVAGLGAAYTQSAWELDMDLTALFRAKSKFLTASEGLIPEARNSHGTEYDLNFNYKYFFDDRLNLFSGLYLTYISPNDYTSDSPYYAGKRNKISIEGGLEKRFSEKLKANAGLGLFYIRDDKNWEHPTESLSYKGINLTAGISYLF